MIVSVIEIDNIGASNVTISFAMNSNKKKINFTEILTKHTLPHFK